MMNETDTFWDFIVASLCELDGLGPLSEQMAERLMASQPEVLGPPPNFLMDRILAGVHERTGFWRVSPEVEEEAMALVLRPNLWEQLAGVLLVGQ